MSVPCSQPGASTFPAQRGILLVRVRVVSHWSGRSCLALVPLSPLTSVECQGARCLWGAGRCFLSAFCASLAFPGPHQTHPLPLWRASQLLGSHRAVLVEGAGTVEPHSTWQTWLGRRPCVSRPCPQGPVSSRSPELSQCPASSLPP